jgi:hypothetical protein
MNRISLEDAFGEVLFSGESILSTVPPPESVTEETNSRVPLSTDDRSTPKESGFFTVESTRAPAKSA